VIEKNGLSVVVDILENYGIDSETDVSFLDQDDLSNLESQGLKPMQGCWESGTCMKFPFVFILEAYLDIDLESSIITFTYCSE